MKSFLSMLTIVACSLVSTAVLAQELTSKSTDSVDKKSFELSEFDKRLLKDRISRIHEKDQQFRSYLSFHTTDEQKITELEKLDVAGQLAAMTQNKNALPDEVNTLLQNLQRKNDKENMGEFLSIVKEYGYPSKERLGVESDLLFVLLLHPPVELEEVEAHTKSLCELLLPEVKAGRMKARLYASFVDNMSGKILRLPQVYGTNQQFDRASGKILPPQIENLEKANKARREIGMPELKDGEYRLASTKD